MKKLTVIMLILAVVFTSVFAQGAAEAEKTQTTVAKPSTYVRGDDEEIYAQVLGGYEALLDKAKAAATDSQRFVIYAQAEAYLLDSAVMIPNTTQGGAYTISRIAPRTVPYVQWGNDDDRWKGMIITADDFLTPAERNELLDIWAKAVKGEATYDPAAWLTSKGHKLTKDYRTTFATAPVTLDTLNTSSQSDTEILVNCTDNLVQYNNLGQMIPALAESWEVSADGLTYTFHIRKGAWWSTSEGAKYAEVTAKDFEAGFHHMLDAAAGLEWLVEGVIEGVSEYLYEGGKWDAVGYKAVDANTLQVTLCAPTSYFMTMLTYSCFAPICESFYLAHGGVFGIEEYAAAYNDTNAYTYGKSTDVASQVYNGAFILQQLNDASIIKVVKNPNYYDPESVKLDSITWVYDNGENMAQFYKDVCDGVYAGCGLTSASGTLEWAKADGNFDKYNYVSDTTSTSYFGGLNLNRGTFALASGAVASPKTEEQKIDTETAMMNKNFRKAVAYAWDKATQNAVSRGADLATTNLRNMYTHPEFVQLSEDVTDASGKKFVAGTMYGEIVQYYLDKMGSPVQVADGIDGWYHPAEAKRHLELAKKELGNSVNWPITIDVVYYSANQTQIAQAQAYKQSIEGVLGAENVTVNLVEATTSADFYASGYRASNGEAGNFDMFYGSGWGPDFGDPCTYLDTFRGNGAGYMTKVIGLF
jgi:ABC-type oligopeptide transport system substrate-binding subunit